MGLKRVPQADSETALDLYDLGQAKLTRMRYLTATELRQSLLLALQAHETRVALHALVASSSRRTHVCGPKCRDHAHKPLVKKR